MVIDTALVTAQRLQSAKCLKPRQEHNDINIIYKKIYEKQKQEKKNEKITGDLLVRLLVS